MVTADKRSESLQAVPIAIVAVTPGKALDYGAVESDELAALAPGVQIQHEINSTTAFVRGVGPNSNGTGEESSVAVYLDDLYIEQGVASVFSLNSISSIEMLKGPQGTLFGRNATGGVIQVRTLDPSSSPSLRADLGYGVYDTKIADLYATGALIPGLLAANVALYARDESAGWGRDVMTGQRAFTSKDWAARAKLLFTPTERTRILLSLNHFYTRGEVGLGFNQVPQYIAAGAPLLTTNATFVGWYNTEDAINDVSIIKYDLVELRVEQQTELATLVDIVGLQRLTGILQFAQDASPEALVLTRLGQGGRDFSNELDVLSPASAPYASWLTWTAGAYYLHDDSGYPDTLLRGAAFGFPISTPAALGLALRDNVDTVSVAGFGQATVQLWPRLRLTLGARYTRDKRVFTGGVLFSSSVPGVGGLPACIVVPLACPTTRNSLGARHAWDLWTERASVDYRFSDDVMAYGSFNQGAKSGQFDTFGTAEAGPVALPPVNPEQLRAYELGMKSEWLDRRARLDIAAFHYDASNLQFATIVAGATRLLNAAGARIDGIELSAEAHLARGLTISAGASLQSGRYTSFPNAPAYFSPPTFVTNAAGNPTVHTPRFTGSLDVGYTLPSRIGTFRIDGNFTHTDRFELFPDRSLQQPATNILNASLTWASPSGRHELRLWARNITADRYYTFGSETLGFGKQFSPAPPATYGVTFGVRL